MLLKGKEQLHKEAAKGLLPVYLLYGEDGPAVEAADKWLRTQAADAFPEANLSVFDGRTGLDVDALADAVQAIPFMAERRCVVVEDLGADALSATQADKLWALMELLPEETTLIITVYSHSLDPGKRTRGAKLHGLCDKAGAACSFPKPGRNELLRQVQEQTKSLGGKIDSAAAGLLLDYCLMDVRRVRAETEKLCGYADGREITRRDVELLVVPATDARVFDLSDKIVRGNLAGALETVDELLFQRETEVNVLSILSMAFVDMYRAAVAGRARVNPQEARKAYGYGGSAFRYNKAVENQRHYTIPQLEQVLRILADTDQQLKSSRGDSRVLLEAAVVRVFDCLGRGPR